MVDRITFLLGVEMPLPECRRATYNYFDHDARILRQDGISVGAGGPRARFVVGT